MQEQHEWVQDFREFEAVLHVTHALPTWDSEATLRAFQTFGFDDATTPGNDMAFSHADTGFVLRYDGEYVAIEFGDGDLRPLLSDLIHVLSQLGWTDAEVFHAPETMGELLNDIGQAIPANMNFDVKGARAVTSISEFAEAGSLIERGQQALRGAVQSDGLSDMMLGELSSMGEELTGAAVSNLASSMEPAEPHVMPGAGVVAAHHEAPASFFDDEAPIVPMLGGSQAQAPLGWLDPQPEHEVEHALPEMQQPMFEPASAAQPPVAERARHELVSHVEPPAVASGPVPVAPVAAQERALSAQAAMAPREQLKSPGFVAGNTRFVLQRAGINVEPVGESAEHVWPGAAQQGWRWDVAGEIDANAPWFAEAFATAMQFDDPAHAAAFAHGVVSWAGWERASLRGLWATLLDSQRRKDLFGPWFDVIDEREFVRASMARLHCVGLFGEGHGFVEPVEGAKSFSVRKLLVDATPRVIVVHLDETDGAFAELLTKLLFDVAARWAASSRSEQLTQAQRAQAERDAEAARKREEAVREGLALVENLRGQLAQLEQLGIKV